MYQSEIMFEKIFLHTPHHVPIMVVEFGLCHLFNLNVIIYLLLIIIIDGMKAALLPIS